MIYRIGTLYWAVGISLAYHVLFFIWQRRYRGKPLRNTQILGMVGLVVSLIGVLFAGNDNYYYLPALMENFVFAGFTLVLTLRKKSIFLYVVRDFEIPALSGLDERSLIGLNVLWLCYFAAKIATKALGILYLDFSVLYWLVFALGDPATILLVLLSLAVAKRKRGTVLPTESKQPIPKNGE